MNWPSFARPVAPYAGPPRGSGAWGSGDLDGFINAYLTASANGTLKK